MIDPNQVQAAATIAAGILSNDSLYNEIKKDIRPGTGGPSEKVAMIAVYTLKAITVQLHKEHQYELQREKEIRP